MLAGVRPHCAQTAFGDTAGSRIISACGLSSGFEAKTCLACDPAPCVAASPTGAYSQRRDECGSAFLASMVSCLFARSVYTDEVLAKCLNAAGYGALAENMKAVSRYAQKLRWKTRIGTGFDPEGVSIPKRFTEVVTESGSVDPSYLEELKKEYARRIREIARDDGIKGP